jgi:hypothetical protein
VAPAPEWADSAAALDMALTVWLAQENPDPPVIFMVAPPHGGHTNVLREWARQHDWPCISPPEDETVFSADVTWLSRQISNRHPWIFPCLERAYFRHARGLTLIRNIMARVDAGDLGRGIIGCDSWAWAFLNRVWQGRKPIVLTLQSCDKFRLAAHFSRLCNPSGHGQMTFQQSDNGQPVLPPRLPDTETAETSNFLELLATHSRGIWGVAWDIWRTSLRSEPDEKEAESQPLTAEKPPPNTIWVIPWSQFVPLELPSGAGLDEAFVLHALLLHNGLPLELLQRLLPLSPSQVSGTLFRLSENGLVACEHTAWQVTAPGYPCVRKFLKAQGYLVDQF